MLRENDLEDEIRMPIDAAEARKVLEHLGSWDGEVSNGWKARANAHQKKLDQGDPYGYAEVCKALGKRQEADSLSAADRLHLKQSEEFLAEELANALGKTHEEARVQIAQAVAS
jgi:RNA polymerase-interacting CarD/CdnL/TRCF family regulator